jgi:hypothetical protein
MKALRVAGAFAVAMAFGTAMALAQSVPHIGDGSNSNPISTKTPGYSVGTGSAHVGDGSSSNYLKNQQLLRTEPGYSIGGSSARKSASSTYNQNSTGQNTPK